MLKNEIGNKYGKLTVIARVKNDGKHAMWKCQCECGNILYTRGDTLRSGRAKSCGCGKRKNNYEEI